MQHRLRTSMHFSTCNNTTCGQCGYGDSCLWQYDQLKQEGITLPAAGSVNTWITPEVIVLPFLV